MGTTIEGVRAGDARMRAGEFEGAKNAYREAWGTSANELDVRNRVWLMLAIAHASLRSGDFEEAFDVCAAAQEHFARPSGIVAGNPLFHLFAGLAADGLGEAAIADDNLARALICGGPAIFTEEDPRHLARTRARLRPPAELGTWDGYAGCSLGQLDSVLGFVDGAEGALAQLLLRRLGRLPPYPQPLDHERFEGACSDLAPRPAPWGRGRTHFVSFREDRRDAVVFFADLDDLPPGGATVRIDYRIAEPGLSDLEARELITHVYFRQFAGGFFRDKIAAFDFGRIDEAAPRFVRPYPA